MSDPIAYAAVAADSSESMYVSVYRDRVEQKCREHGWHLVPMYGSPPSNAWQLVHENERLRDEVFRLRLTEKEREAIDEAWCAIGRSDDHSESAKKRIRSALLGLLERMK